MSTNLFSAGKRIAALVSVSSLVLSACASPVAGPSGLYAQPTGNAPVVANPTPYSDALVCEAEYARAHNVNAPRIAIGRIADYTGKLEADGSGRKVTQGASLMAMSAFAKAGIPLVERYDTSVSELELKYANSKLISDHPNPGGQAPADYRRIMAGQVPGSDFYLAGGITELNFNIRSNGANVDGGGVNSQDVKATLGGQTYIMNVGLDLRLINTRTLEVVDVISYQKQIVAHQVGVGAFFIWNGNAFDASAGEGALEPLQLGVRAVIERAAVEMVANLYGMSGPDACLHADPLNEHVTTGVTGAYVPAYNNVETNNAATRQDPNRWDAHRDPAVDTVVRDRY
ncbi:MAG TPA: holdfast anchoring protein HfaB [Caulobacteraceae bacterium]|jgi:curli production assembly/transport component CsgG/holdfast attachment protein HfaB|nr:holdfast anchoring protein HfaB [Caulobacteraceae bacterium]